MNTAGQRPNPVRFAMNLAEGRLWGPLLTVASVAGIELLGSLGGIDVPAPFVIVLATVMVSAYAGGIGAGMASAALCALFGWYLIAVSGAMFSIPAENLPRLAAVFVSPPALAWIASYLKGRFGRSQAPRPRAAQGAAGADSTGDWMDHSESRLRAIADSLPALIADIDSDNVVQFANLLYEEWFGRPRDRILGHGVREILGEEAFERARPYVERVLAGEAVEFEQVLARDGRPRHVHFRFIPRSAPDGRREGYFVLGTDVTVHKELEEELRHMAQHDALTGVPNRALFEDRLQQALERGRRNHRSLAVMYLDLDHFKEINDRYGHKAGDELLMAFAERVRSCLRSSDTVARRGGDEFVALIEGLAALDDASRVAEKIVAAMRDPFLLPSGEIHATASVGVSLAIEGKADRDELIASADQALYEAKSKGRNTFHVKTGS